VRQFVIKVLTIIDAQCNHEVYCLYINYQLDALIIIYS